jgi:hypothetical protein
MLTSRIPALLRQALGPRWEFIIDGDHITIQHPQRGTPYRPPRRQMPWSELLATLEAAFADLGVPRTSCLPLRWGRETELTISAVQALDPYLKHRQPVPYRRGFLPQPVVRLTGQRDERGTLSDGFLTSFVNISRIEPIADLGSYATILDEWLTVLSRLSLHARHITIHGRLTVWRRRQVEGITLRYNHAGLPLGDIVLLWNACDPTFMAVDLGTALERLAWARARGPWQDLVFGSFANAAAPRTLDAIRTATLLLGHGVMPAARGPGSITRRVVATIPSSASPLGFSSLIRASHSFWNQATPLVMSWPAVTCNLEREITSLPTAQRPAS